MACLRTFFGFLLTLRAAYHLYVAGYAISDLNTIHDATSGLIQQIAIKFTSFGKASLYAVEVPLVFYVVCGIGLLVLASLYPWKDSHRSHLSIYATLHLLYIAMVVYVVYIRQVIQLSYFREVYRLVEEPTLWPTSLVLDVLTFITACVSTKKNSASESITGILPYYREA